MIMYAHSERTYLLVVSTFPPSSGVPFLAYNDDVLSAVDGQQVHIGIFGHIVRNDPGRLVNVLPRNFQEGIQPSN